MSRSQFSVVVVDKLAQLSAVAKLVDEYSFLSLAGAFKELRDALEFITASTPDIVIIDAKYQAVIGTDWLEPSSHSPEVIVVGTYVEFAQAPEFANGYPIFYINKPIREQELLIALKNSIQTINAKVWRRRRHEKLKKPNGYIFVKTQSGFKRLVFEAIDYVRAFDGGVMICHKGEFLRVNSTLSILENELPDTLFCRVHKSYLVRLDRIQSFSGKKIQMADASIPLGRGNKENFENAIVKIS